jgi:hypothetical protein
MPRAPDDKGNIVDSINSQRVLRLFFAFAQLEPVSSMTYTDTRMRSVTMKKTTVNYWVDLAIGFSFVFSAISGLVFVLPFDATTGVLGISYQAWNSLHTWSSLALIAGVGAHLALHWNWTVSMTRRMLSPAGCQTAPKTTPWPAHTGAESTRMSRRAFLAAAGTTAAAAGLLVAATAVFGTDGAEAGSTEQEDTSLAEASSTANQVSSTSQGRTIACPRGLVNDPYPGKCHHYVDTTGDGFCDYSVPA